MEVKTVQDKKCMRVAVVGGGLVGALECCFLARRGHHVELYEYREELKIGGGLKFAIRNEMAKVLIDIACAKKVIQGQRSGKLVFSFFLGHDIRKTPHSRGRTINLSLSTRGRLALSRLGLEDKALNLGLPLRGRMIHRPNDKPLPTLYDPQTKECIYSVNRKQLNEMLLTEAESYANVSLQFNEKVIDADLDDGVITILNVITKQTRSHQVDLIIGADGAFSAIRRCIMKRSHFNYSQEYIQHGYLELSIPPIDGVAAMDDRYLHLWPRENYMMVAMPNQDKSFTVTLFMPFDVFERITTVEHLLDFFNTYFEDAVALVGKDQLVADFFGSKLSPLLSIKCNPYHVSNKAVLLGDAAHAMVPFYGQGMNAGFEDCVLLDDLLARYSTSNVLSLYTQSRYEDAHAICDMAMYNFSEIGTLVIRPTFQWRRKVDNLLNVMLGDRWIPLYQSVSFTTKPYKECWSEKLQQDKIINAVTISLVALISLIITFLANKLIK